MSKLVFLKSVPMFNGLSLDNLVALDRELTHATYLPGESIVREGEVGDRLFVVAKGEVVVRKKHDSDERELTRLHAGEMFGEMSLFDDLPRSASVIAAGDAEVLALDRDHFNSLVQQRPQILMQICRVLVTRLRTAIS